jgi:CRP-like cAMP-binding protein
MTRSIKVSSRLLREHPFFRDLPARFRDRIGDCAAPAVLEAGSFAFRKGEPAECCYLIRHGQVSLEMPVAGGDSLVVETLRDNEVMGWSWLVAPYRATLDARVLTPTTVIRLDGACLRACIETDDELGFTLYKLFKPIMARQMAASRRQLQQGLRACSG